MFKIKTTDYTFPAPGPEGEIVQIAYKVKDSFAQLLMSPHLKLGGAALLKNHAVAQRILDCEEECILLEAADYHKLRQAVESYEGFDMPSVEMVKRVMEAEDVPVEELKIAKDDPPC